ncbi:peptidoglycan-binding domain-containing protein [Streptomyces phaeochromogenes]
MTRRSVKSFASVGALFVGLLAGNVAAASSASADTLRACNGVLKVQTPGGIYNYYIPYHSSADGGAGAGFNCYVIQGNQGEDVRAIQRSLHWCYGKTGVAVDGIFGSITFNALKDVQSDLGLVPDGEYGDFTSRKLRWPLYKATTGERVNLCSSR